MKRIATVMLGLAVASAAAGAPCHAATAATEENNYIAVTGSGEAQQWPDSAVITVYVQAVEKTTKEAAARTTELLGAMAGDLKKAGIPEEKIEFLPPFVERKAERVRQADGEYREVPVGFESVQMLRVTIAEPGRAGEILTMLTNRSAQVRGGDIGFEVDDPGKLEARARAVAIGNARKKAQDYATGAGRKLGRLLVVEESMTSRFRLFPTLRAEITGVGDYDQFSIRASDSSPGNIPLTPQPVSAHVTLYVKFALQ